MALIEREHELERLETVLAEAAAGRGSALLIEGAPGIGKTVLLDAARELAGERNIRPLSARAGELERGVAFGIARQLLDPPLREVDVAGRRELLAGAARLAEGPLGLAPEPDRGGSPPAPGAELHGLYWLSANLADRGPVLLAVDDLHWTDEPSLRFLAYLARRAEEHPLLICAASRPPSAEAPGALAHVLDAIRSEALRLRPLSVRGVERVVRETLTTDADPDFCAACARATGGNPFLLSATLAALRHDGIAPVAAEAERVEGLRPETLSRALLLRLARLGSDASGVAHAIATLGADATLGRAARLARLAPDAAATAIDGLRREGVLAAGSRLEFVHPLVRNAVDADLDEPARGLAHLRAAQLLDEAGEATERVAPHLLAAEPNADPWVVEMLHEAAAAALASGAPEPAVGLLERALAEPPAEAERPVLELQLGRALARAGRLDGAVESMRRALELTDEPPRRAEIALELGVGLQLARQWPVALEIIENALQGLGDDHPELALRLEVQIVFAGQTMLQPASEWIGRLEATAESPPGESPTLGMALSILAFTAAGTGSKPADEVARLARRASKLGPFPVEGVLLSFAGAALTIAGHPGEGLGLTDRGIHAATQSGDAPQFSFQSLGRSRVALEAGRVRQAEADARAALDAHAGGVASLAYALGVLVLALVQRGRVDEAQAELARHDLADARGFETLPDFVLLQARGALRIAQGRLRDAVEDLMECRAMLASIGFTNPALSDWRSGAALAHLGLGEAESARRLGAEELELAKAFGAPRAIGIALRTMGLVEGGEPGIELLRESVSVLDRSEAELERAYSVVELGAALRRSGRRRDSRKPLRRGLDLASRCGAMSLAERAREELVVAGARPRRTLVSGPESLTASELRVTRLAVEGMTNREIAQALFVTRRTVEVHLTSAYRKLEISSREELGPALEDPSSSAIGPAGAQG